MPLLVMSCEASLSSDLTLYVLTILHSYHNPTFVSELGSDTFSSLSFSRITGLSRKQRSYQRTTR